MFYALFVTLLLTTVQYVFRYRTVKMNRFSSSSMLSLSFDNEFGCVCSTGGELWCGGDDFLKVLYYKACMALLNSRRCSIPSYVFSLVYLSIFDSQMPKAMIWSCTTFVRCLLVHQRLMWSALGHPYPEVGGLGLGARIFHSQRIDIHSKRSIRPPFPRVPPDPPDRMCSKPRPIHPMR